MGAIQQHDNFAQMMEEVHEINAELEKISQISEHYSEALQTLERDVKEFSDKLGDGLLDLSKYGVAISSTSWKTNNRDFAKKAGIATAAAAGIGLLSKAVGDFASEHIGNYKQSKAQKKREAARAAILDDKQQIAQQKLPFLDRQIPRMERMNERLGELSLKFANRKLSQISDKKLSHEADTTSMTIDRYSSILETVYKINRHKTELEAWDDGKHHARRNPYTSEVNWRIEAYGEVLENSDPCVAMDPFDIQEEMTIGTFAVLRDHELSNTVAHLPKIEYAANRIEEGYFTGSITRRTERDSFRTWYKMNFGSSPVVQRKIDHRIFNRNVWIGIFAAITLTILAMKYAV